VGDILSGVGVRQQIQFPVDGDLDDLVTVEVVRPDPPGLERASLATQLHRADQSFEAALARIKPIINGVISNVRGLAQAPDEVKVVLGVKFDAKAGVVLSSAGAEANLELTLTWRRTANAAP
jgi:hypothetical protein